MEIDEINKFLDYLKKILEQIRESFFELNYFNNQEENIITSQKYNLKIGKCFFALSAKKNILRLLVDWNKLWLNEEFKNIFNLTRIEIEDKIHVLRKNGILIINLLNFCKEFLQFKISVINKISNVETKDSEKIVINSDFEMKNVSFDDFLLLRENFNLLNELLCIDLWNKKNEKIQLDEIFESLKNLDEQRNLFRKIILDCECQLLFDVRRSFFRKKIINEIYFVKLLSKDLFCSEKKQKKKKKNDEVSAEIRLNENDDEDEEGL